MRLLPICLSLCLSVSTLAGCKTRSLADASMGSPPADSVEFASAEGDNPFYCNEDPNSAFSCLVARAQEADDLAAIERLVAAFIETRGDRAGLPDRQADYQSVSASAVGLSEATLSTAYELYVQQINRVDWWNSPEGPSGLPPNLRSANYVRPRFLSYVVAGFVAASNAGAGDRDQLLAVARNAADYLVLSQQEAGQGLFPFPDLQAVGIPYAHSDNFRAIATRLGKLDDVLINDWYVDDLGEGGLQLDNGLAGVAMLDLYKATGEEKYLTSALEAADWAMAQTPIPNWNYNSVSVHLLARAYGETGDVRYLESAKKKARIGVYPGQLQAGPHKGFWADPHNARLNYHYVLIRGVGALVAVMPKDDPEFSKAQTVLSTAVAAGSQRILDNGIVYPELLLETLSELALAFPPSSDRLDDLGRQQTLDLLGRFASDKVLVQGRPIEPSAWGLYLEAFAAADE